MFAMHVDPDFSDSDDDEKVVGYTKGKIYRQPHFNPLLYILSQM